MTRRVPCVGAVIRDDADRLLLVRRAHAPATGTWSLPGGRVEAGEADPDAVVREVAEETGVRVDVGALVGTVERAAPADVAAGDAPAGVVYVINDYACTVIGGEARPGDDATEVRWCSPDDIRALPTSPRLVETLESWGVLPPPSNER